MSVSVVKDEFELKNDMFEVTNKKPGYTYRLLNINSRNLAAKQRKGYEIVKDNDPEKLTLRDNTPIKKGSDLDSTQRLNDVILARIPNDRLEKIRATNQALIKRQSQMILQDFDRDTGPLGFNPNRDPTGHATRYHAGTTQLSFDKQTLTDKAFEEKYGMPKGQVEE